MRAAALAVLLAACSTSSRAAQEDLMMGARELQEGLRWRNYDHAALRIPQAERMKFLDAHEALDDDLRIDEYEIERVTMAEDKDHATVRVRYKWHLEKVGLVHDTLVDQAWERQGKVWRITSSTHRRGEDLPPLALPAPALR